MLSRVLPEVVAVCMVILLIGCSVTGGGRAAPRIPELKGEAERAALEAAVDSLRVRARECVADTIRRTGERLGRPNPDPGAVRVEVELRLGGRTPCGRGAACTSGWGRSMKIQLSAETFLSGDGELELTARHEAIHAYFRRQLGWWRYRGLPPWVQEGLAIHLAGQTREKVVDLVYWDSEHTEAELAGLEARESLDHYAEYGLAFEFLEGFPGGVE